MIGIIKYLTVEQLYKYQNHLIISSTDFGDAQAKAKERGYKRGLSDGYKKKVEHAEMGNCAIEYNRGYQQGRADQAKEDDELNYHYATSHDCWLKGRADALDELITHIKACEKEAYDNVEPLIGSVFMAIRIKAEQLKEQSNDIRTEKEAFQEVFKQGYEQSRADERTLDKQTSKKVIIKETEDETMDMETGEWYPYIREDWFCPSCGDYVVPVDYKYCANCGQKLDWSEVD